MAPRSRTAAAGGLPAYRLGSIGAGTGLAVTSMFSHRLLGEVNLWFIAPMGARRAVLLFGVAEQHRWRSRGRLSAVMCCRR
ncbi:hypothetical protein LNO36_19600 [Klebsiella variicola subsp. variicola]|nr:hypothetical protein [Klebsiella variicola subsp. variicola]